MNLATMERYPGAIERLRKDGYPALARMAEILERPSEMDKALGTQNAACHWLAGRNGVSGPIENAARLWLETYHRTSPETEVPDNQEPAGDGAVLMVVCPADKAGKVHKVLGLMGCEVEVI